MMLRQMPRRGSGCCARMKLRWTKTGPIVVTGLLTGPPGLDAILPRGGRVILIRIGDVAWRKTGPTLRLPSGAPLLLPILPLGGSGNRAWTGVLRERNGTAVVG